MAQRVQGVVARSVNHPVEVVTIESIELDGERLRALETAVAEAVMNVGKHSGVRRAVVFGQRRDDGSTFVSVKDGGRGFDVDAAEGFGLRSSIAAPVEAVGGGAKVTSVVGEGTEVRLWVP